MCPFWRVLNDYACMLMYTIVDYFTVAETARLLKVNPITVRRHIQGGRLSAIRAGRGVRIRRGDLEAFLQPVSMAPVPPIHPLTEDDSLWTLVGAATHAPPSDASRKHDYLADRQIDGSAA